MKTPRYRWLIVAGWACVGLSFLGLLTWHLDFGADQQKISLLSAAGDWIGGITAPLLNLAGFVLIYAAFKEQTASSQRARTEFELQRFEDQFFNLINLHHQNVNAIQDVWQQLKVGDNHFFAWIRHFMAKQCKEDFSPETVEAVYQTLYKDQHARIDHFARHLLLIVSIINGSQVLAAADPKVEKAIRHRYIDILSTQLSTHELVVLYYHSLFDPSGHATNSRQQLLAVGMFDRLLQDKADLLLAPHHKDW